MGTVLSLSPGSGKGKNPENKSDFVGGYSAIPNSKNGKPEKSLKKHHVLISALTWKRLVAVSTKRKNAKKVNPNLGSQPKNISVEKLNNQNLKKSLQQPGSDRKGLNRDHKPGPLPVPVPTVPNQNQNCSQPGSKQLGSVKKQPNSRVLYSPRRIIVQASTGELLRCLGEFICRRCYKLKDLSPNEPILWFRNVDRSLLLQGWQDQGFITPANLVFVYMLCREAIKDDINSEAELQAAFLTSLYLAYSYMGNEISYPLKPFLAETNKEVFWERCLKVIDKMSVKMLQINADPHFFTQVFQDLKNEGEVKDSNGHWTINLDR